MSRTSSVCSLLPACPGDVKREIEAALTICENAELAFYGGSFTAIPMEEQRALLDAAAPYLESGSISSIRLSTRPDAINEEILAFLKEKGVKTIELGSQSMCDSVLAASWRGHTAADTEKAAEMIKSAGFNLILPNFFEKTFTRHVKTVFFRKKRRFFLKTCEKI